MVIGGHGDTTMIPLTRLASYNGIPVSQFLSEEELKKRYHGWWSNTYRSLGTSAWYAGASVVFLVDSILNDQKKMIACSVFLLKEMVKMIFAVFLLLVKNGIEEILDIALMMKKSLVCKSADAVRQMNDALKSILA
jgi:malate dehydrogenase